MADFEKDPEAVLDYVFDWSSWLAQGETLIASVVTATPGINLDSYSNTTTRTTAWVSGGTSGTPYLITNHITTSSARQDDRSISIRVTPR